MERSTARYHATEKVFAIFCFAAPFFQSVIHWLSAEFGEHNIVPHPVPEGMKHLLQGGNPNVRKAMLFALERARELQKVKRVVLIGEEGCLGYNHPSSDEQYAAILRNMAAVREIIQRHKGFKRIPVKLAFGRKPTSNHPDDCYYRIHWVRQQ